MPQTTIALRTFTDSILARLQTNAEGLSVYDGEAPKGALSTLPFTVLAPELSTELTDDGGTLADPNAHPIMEWQMTSVGRSREQAQWCSDIMRAVLIATPLTTAGRNVWIVNVGALGQIERDDDVDIGGITGSLFYANDLVEIPSSPS